jgi:hypothetical protein
MEREAIGLAGREYHRPELLLPVILVPEDQDVPDPELEVQLRGQAERALAPGTEGGGAFRNDVQEFTRSRRAERKRRQCGPIQQLQEEHPAEHPQG